MGTRVPEHSFDDVLFRHGNSLVRMFERFSKTKPYGSELGVKLRFGRRTQRNFPDGREMKRGTGEHFDRRRHLPKAERSAGILLEDSPLRGICGDLEDLGV
jgi:hypothetical protein